MTEKDILYQFLYCDCIHESAWATISIHRSREGAVNAMEEHKAEEKKKWEEYADTEERKKEFPFGQHEDWSIGEIELHD